jgi:ketosteroid isomerase-like protein
MSDEVAVRIIRDYMSAIERAAPFEEVAAYLHPDVVFEEYPNRVTPNGAVRTLAEARIGAERGKQLLSRQTYEVLNSLVDGNQVAMEVQWTAELAIPLGTLKAGDTMRARFGVFFELRDGRIWRQRNYDCFDPW